MPDTPRYQTQTATTPLFPKLLWNRPVSRRAGGRLLVVGGQPGHISEPQTMYAVAESAGIGECRVILPDSLAKIVGTNGPASYVPSNPVGSLGQIAFGEISQLAQDYDSLLLAPEAGNNSETAILLEKLARSSEQNRVFYGDALTALGFIMPDLVASPDHLFVVTMAQLFKIAGRLEVGVHIRRDGGMLNQVEIVADVAAAGQASYAILGSDIIIASGGQVSVTPLSRRSTPALQVATAALLASSWTQNPGQHFEGLTTGAYIMANTLSHIPAADTLTTTNLTAGITAAIQSELTNF
jgi:hypothetical protein